jgi:hypothetical protein
VGHLRATTATIGIGLVANIMELLKPTLERARWPRQVVRAVYKALKVNGYDGPEPQFNELWMSLFD